jgi:hypothetical protein
MGEQPVLVGSDASQGCTLIVPDAHVAAQHAKVRGCSGLGLCLRRWGAVGPGAGAEPRLRWRFRWRARRSTPCATRPRLARAAPRAP